VCGIVNLEVGIPVLTVGTYISGDAFRNKGVGSRKGVSSTRWFKTLAVVKAGVLKV